MLLALRHPGRYRSVSAFAPICHLSACDWGRKALSGYLGDEREAWRDWDVVELIKSGARCPPLLVDQGTADEFLAQGQLLPDALRQACEQSGQALSLREQAGYDHSYYFVASFIGEHIAHQRGGVVGGWGLGGGGQARSKNQLKHITYFGDLYSTGCAITRPV